MRSIRIVLAEPRDGRNVGAVCRAMKTMGLGALSIVGGQALDLEKARILAVHAADVLEGALFHRSLEEAVGDAVLVAGVTRRMGRKRKTHSLTPEALAERISRVPRGTVALVFGNEEAGLSDEEMALCHLAVHIPSSPDFPSLNLSHAVQVIAYVLHRQATREDHRAAAREFTPIKTDQLDALVRTIVETLHSIGYQTQPGSRGMGAFWHDILGRAQLSAGEARRLAGLFHNLGGMLSRRQADGPGFDLDRPRN